MSQDVIPASFATIDSASALPSQVSYPPGKLLAGSRQIVAKS